MILDHYPAMRNAILLIAYDNGCINRTQTEDELLKRCDSSLLFARINRDDLVRIEADLAKLNEADLETVCNGDERKANWVDVLPMTRKLLDHFFEAM